jgi:hypothetical protein
VRLDTGNQGWLKIRRREAAGHLASVSVAHALVWMLR